MLSNRDCHVRSTVISPYRQLNYSKPLDSRVICVAISLRKSTRCSQITYCRYSQLHPVTTYINTSLITERVKATVHENLFLNAQPEKVVISKVVAKK